MPESKDYEKALKMARRKTYRPENVVALLERAIAEGDTRAAFALGTWYLHGRHIRRNRRKAYGLIAGAAVKGNASALYHLAVFYEKGLVVEKDPQRALALYIDAALRGDAQAHYEVGRFFWHGIGVEANEAIAGIWLKNAAELGIRH